MGQRLLHGGAGCGGFSIWGWGGCGKLGGEDWGLRLIRLGELRMKREVRSMDL